MGCSDAPLRCDTHTYALYAHQDICISAHGLARCRGYCDDVVSHVHQQHPEKYMTEAIGTSIVYGGSASLGTTDERIFHERTGG